MNPENVKISSFKEIASGCISIINGIANIRNDYSDSHGKGKNYTKPKNHHTKFIINIAKDFSEFILDIFNNKK